MFHTNKHAQIKDLPCVHRPLWEMVESARYFSYDIKQYFSYCFKWGTENQKASDREKAENLLFYFSWSFLYLTCTFSCHKEQQEWGSIWVIISKPFAYLQWIIYSIKADENISY